MEEFISILIAGFVSVFVLAICLMCGIFCIAFWRKRNNAVYSSPVVVTGQTYQPSGQPAFPVSVQTTQNLESQPTAPPNSQITQPSSLYPPPQNSQMPLSYPNANQPHFPLPNQLPYPSQDPANFPQPSTSLSNDLHNSDNERNDDLPPSYHKIDKL